MSGLHIVALGSSFAAGPGIPPSAPGVPPSAGQSAHNYSHLLAARLGAGLTDLSCSGATLRNVLDEPQKPPSSLFPCRDEGTIMPPQVDGVPANADIVTLTAGGNDMGYSWAMALDAARAAVLGPPKHYVPRRRNSSRHADLHVTIDRFTAVIDAVKRKAPGATVYLVQYVDVLGPETRTDAENPLSQAQIDHFVAMGQELATAFALAVELRPDDAVLVKMSDMSRGHELGGKVPWVRGFSLWSSLLWGDIAPYHPNEAAHVAIAEELERVITKRIARGQQRGNLKEPPMRMDAS